MLHERVMLPFQAKENPRQWAWGGRRDGSRHNAYVSTGSSIFRSEPVVYISIS